MLLSKETVSRQGAGVAPAGAVVQRGSDDALWRWQDPGVLINALEKAVTGKGVPAFRLQHQQ